MEHAPKPEKKPPDVEEEVKIFEGKKYRKVDSGYTIREWYSHESPRKGPGPGWDTWNSNFDEICKKYGLIGDSIMKTPEELPDKPYYMWELVEE